MSRLNKLPFALAALVTVAGCADERPPRSFVQPNVIKKSDLQGTWYYIQTVTDAPPTNGSMFIGQSSSLMKVRFDVQEDFLYARRSYEQIQGSEDAFALNPEKYSGEPLAAWKISSQFDIIRDYNSTTGEQTNKIIESTERPWNEREFVRVDWSQNLVTDYVGIGLDLFFSDGSPTVEPVSWWESDPTSPDSLHMERNQDSASNDGFQVGEATYLDITNQLVITPDNLTASYEENGQVQSFSYPKCFFYYEQDDCASQRVKVRHAFAKIGPTHDYEPRNWDGIQMQLFGVWDVDLRRLTYNRQYGITNSGVNRHAARFNIWQKSYQPDGKTLIDPKDRQIKSIPYYAEGSQPVTYSNDEIFPDGTDSIYPEDLFPQFKEIVKEWNDAMKVAVSDAQAKPVSMIGDVFVACHNPVRQSPWHYQGQSMPADPDACKAGLQPDMDSSGNIKLDKVGNPILHLRAGDPRHSTVFWVNQQQNAGPLGYGPPLYDPETGETISGQAYIYGAALDTYAARSRDLMLLENGEITPEDFTTGVNVQDWVNQHRFGVSSRGPNTFNHDQVQAMSEAMDFSWAKGLDPKYGYPQIDPTSNTSLKNSLDIREGKIFDGFFSHQDGSQRDTNLMRIVGTPLESMMMNNTEMMAASGVSPMKKVEELTEVEKLKVSPIRSRIMRQSSEAERIKAETVGVDFASFDDPGLGQRLQRYLTKYGNTLSTFSEDIRQSLRRDIFLAVTLHEVGHNMGCRHNFRASYDAMNYFPDHVDPTDGQQYQGYWHLRTQAMQNPDAGMPVSDGKLHPRYVNIAGGAVTQFEYNNAIRETQYSSIMDYGAEFNSDLHGLGLYDKALIKFSYAKFVEVFTDNKTDAPTLTKIGSLHVFQNALGFPSPLGPGAGLSAIPYHQYPDLFNSGVDGIYQRADVPYSDISTQSLDNMGNTIVADSQMRPIVPYYFCSDEFAGNLTCQRFDAGADAYEQATDLISRYQNFYIYNNFKRDKQSFHSSLGYKDRISGRYFDPLREQLTWYVLLRADFQNFLSVNASLGSGDPKKVLDTENAFFTDENGWGNFTVAIALGFDQLGATLTAPNAGGHYKATAPDGSTVWKQFNDTTQSFNDPRVRTVGLIDGKYPDTTWDFTNCGYYWAEECQTRVGYFIDKTIALDVLSQSQAYFTGRDTSVDVRQYAIGYILPFKQQMEEKFGALFSEDQSSTAPYFVAGPNQTTIPKQPSWIMDDPTVLKKDPIDPTFGFTLELYAGVYGLSAFPTTFDHDFIDTTKVFVVGNGEASVSDQAIVAGGTNDPTQLVSHGGAFQWLVVPDPINGKTYAAHATPAAQATVLDADSQTPGQVKTVSLRNDQGVRMLENVIKLSNMLAAANAMPDSDPGKAVAVSNATLNYTNFRENVEVMRSLQNAFGYGQYKTDAPFYY